MISHPDSIYLYPDRKRGGYSRMKGAPSRKLRKRGGSRRMRGGNVGNTYIFYHIYCNEYTLDIVHDQATKIIFSGLYDAVKTIYCFVAGKKEYVDKVQSYLKNLPVKFKVEKVGVDDTSEERFTLNAIGGLITDNDIFLYIHTKGVLRTSGKDVMFEPVYLWRNYMEYNLIRHYAECIKLLGSHDLVGTIYKEKKIGPHFSGNFWWTTGKYYRNLIRQHKIGDYYPGTEKFIFLGNPKIYKFDGDKIPNEECFYRVPHYHNRYVDDKSIPGLNNK